MIHRRYAHLVPGFLLAVLLSAAAVALQRTELFSKIIPLSSLIIAIVIGFVINNSFPLPAHTRSGIRFSSKRVLRLAIIFLGFRLSLSEVAGMGPSALAVIAAASILTVVFTLWLGRLMGIPLKRALLLGSGISICGASAVAAVDGVINSKEEDTAFAIGAITLLGTVFMLVYPLIYTALGLSDASYALWAGSSIHEVAQVTAAGSIMADPTSQALASSVKMIRVLLIVPFTLVLLFFPWDDSSAAGSAEKKRTSRIAVPWFAVLFFVAVVINSLNVVPKNIVAGINLADNWAMTVAMAALGLDISLRAMMKIGRKAFVLGIVSSLLISAVSALLIFAAGHI
jgi:uncharacterized integral membrane protein (TIGR00698 family)